ncbi:MutS-related protein [Pirellulaceae bacterium SH501]
MTAVVETREALSAYEERIASFQETIEKSKRLSKTLIRCRVGSALPGLLMIVVGVAEPSLGSWMWKVGLLLLGVFLFFATWYETIQYRIQNLQSQLFGLQRLVHRCHRNWNELSSLPAEEYVQPYAAEWTKDLDVFGDRSVFRWLSLAMTRTGAETLARWLTEWAEPSDIESRQQAVRELARNRSWRLDYFRIACGLRSQRTYPEAIAEWAASQDFFSKKRWLQWLTCTGPALVVLGSLLLIASLLTAVEIGQIVGLGLLLVGLGLNFVLTMIVLGPVHDLFNRIGYANRELQLLSDWISCVGRMPHDSRLLKQFHDSLLTPIDSQPNAQHGIGKLQYWMTLAGFQKSPLFFLPYVVLQITVLWDIRVLEGLERWKRNYRSIAPFWIESIGCLEALTSAAAVADEYPEWCFPTIAPRGSVLTANGLAHPLLRDTQRVPNDLAIEERQRLLLVTGSNMAGKSTLLRSVGVNILLARIGAPVCSKHWVSESMDIASSIRVQDSLQDGVSFFMAELQRLRRVVDKASTENREGGHRMLVLLDEILQGTNSRERQIAVDSVLRRLIDLGCVVLASTHDLELASSDQMGSYAQIVHFREYFELVDGKPLMRFDYKMRPGVTPTTNALKLLEMVGL